MCDGKFEIDFELAEKRKKMRYVRSKASYFMRGIYRKIGGKNCVYCGVTAQTGDHVPALFVGFMNAISKGVIVSSCFDCNKLLWSFSSTCLKARASYLCEAYENEISKTEELFERENPELNWQQRTNLFALKLKRCEIRTHAINCNMLTGSAKIFAENTDFREEMVNSSLPKGSWYDFSTSENISDA